MLPFSELPEDEQKRLIKAMLKRMADAYGIKRSELPARLGTNKNTVNNWTYYMRVPFEQMFDCARITGVSFDWLLSGEEVAPMSHDEKIQTVSEVKSMHRKVLDDGVEYGVISQNTDNGVDLLVNKFERDLKRHFKLPLDDKGNNKGNGTD